VLTQSGGRGAFSCAFILGILCLLGVTQSSPDNLTSIDAPSKTSSARQQWAVQQAKTWFNDFVASKISEPSSLSVNVRAQLTPDVLKNESVRLRQLGTPINFSFLGSGPIQGSMGYYVMIQFKSARVIEALAYDGSEKITGIDFQVLEPKE
jgi:hypothetical protein